MTHRHELGQGFNIAYMEEYVWCVHCKKRWNKEEITRMVNATEYLSAEVAECAAESFEKTSTAHFPSDYDGIGQSLIDYAKTLRGEQ